jgi:hypothetical protein
LQVVQDFRELNNHSHIDKYSMKEIAECIGDIGRANFFYAGPHIQILADATS